jgi:hypothetical protein
VGLVLVRDRATSCPARVWKVDLSSSSGWRNDWPHQRVQGQYLTGVAVGTAWCQLPLDAHMCSSCRLMWPAHASVHVQAQCACASSRRAPVPNPQEHGRPGPVCNDAKVRPGRFDAKKRVLPPAATPPHQWSPIHGTAATATISALLPRHQLACPKRLR